MRIIVWSSLCLALTAASTTNQRIVGGSVVIINNYPDITTLHYSPDLVNFGHYCGGSILNQKNILTAAHCFHDERYSPQRWRFRVGSSFAHSGGAQHNVEQIMIHPAYNRELIDSDIALLRSATYINYINNVVRAATIAGSNYSLGDNQIVWAAGWGATESASSSEQLRHVQVWTINQAVCRERYERIGEVVTENMLCSGWLDVGGRDQCQGDSGGPLYHNGYVVGICSWGYGCAQAEYPGVNVRVSRFTSWIQNNV